MYLGVDIRAIGNALGKAYRENSRRVARRRATDRSGGFIEMRARHRAGSMTWMSLVASLLVIYLNAPVLAGSLLANSGEDFVSAQADPAGAGEARAIAFRKEFGLASDLATVRRVAGDPSNSLEFGVPLAPEEVAELLRRQEVASQREPLIAALAKDPRFGGLYVVQAEGGRIHIRVTRSDAALADLVESLLPPGGSYVFEPAEFTMAELTTVRLDIEADFNSLRAEFGVKHLGVDPVANRVEIGIHPYSEKVAADLVDRYGQQVRVVTSEP